jgi:outer membrane protein OmpA-like peptidoglycan-associated protein
MIWYMDIQTKSEDPSSTGGRNADPTASETASTKENRLSKAKALLKIFACAGVLVGCAASFPPTELIDARQACAHASATPATLLVPEEMRKAHEALAGAEKSFLDSHDSNRTRELAVQAYRLAKRAEALAKTVGDSLVNRTADNAYQDAQTEQTARIMRALAASVSAGKLDSVQPPDQKQIALNESTNLKANLEKLATVTEESRGLVCTLSGDTIFEMNTPKLTQASQHILNQVTQVLKTGKERKLIVEGHTDSRGSSRLNRKLSQDRADTLRAYMILCGYPGDLILATGIGADRPVADNTSVEGRARNRRVEIIVARAHR